jgi:eukaryotic-like serine/threonine-protein kinase
MESTAALDRDSLVMGRYRPLRPLGAGGSGSVWLVRDERTDRDVALKVVALEGKAGSRAQREVEAGARLRHPRCLRALSLDRDERHVYVAYPYVDGTTLREAFRAGELDEEGAVEAAAQVLDALAHAHRNGIVHRDVKPANIMLEARRSRGSGGAVVGEDLVSVRVLDFGLAQLSEVETLTAAGDVPGTLAYIAPERLDGREATGAADVWAVGVILWEALAGRHPFSCGSPLDTAQRIRSGAPPLTSRRPDLPTRLCAAVDGMLALDPKRRPRPERAAAALRRATADSEEPTLTPSSGAVRTVPHAVHAGLAGLFTLAAALLLPFFPTGWPFLLGGLVALAALANPSAGLALALAAPLLPLGNVSRGLALAYVPLALAWYALFGRDPRSGLLFALGPLLAPLGALGLAPALVAHVRSSVRRALAAGFAVLGAVAVAALVGSAAPLTGDETGATPDLGATASPGAAAGSVAGFLAAHPALWIEAVVFAAAAATTGLARSRGLLGVGLWGACFLAAALLAPAGAVGVFPLVLAVAGGTLLLAIPPPRPLL